MKKPIEEKPEKIRLTLSQNIKKRRELLGLSQERLAEAAGLSVQTINTIEGCRMWVSDKTISRLAKVLEIEVFQLFVPYNEKTEQNTPAANLLELRQRVHNEIEIFNTQIDLRFNEALKTHLPRQKEELKEKPTRVKNRKTR